MKNNNKLTVVMYHYVRDLVHSRYPKIHGLQIELFREQVQFLKKNYNFVTVEQILDAYENNSVRDFPEHPVLLTFDDAYKDHFDFVFPYLEHEHIQGAFYAPVKAVTENSVLDVNKIHFILASTPEEKLSQLLGELKYQLDYYRKDWNLHNYDYYFDKLAVANRFDSKEVIFIKRLLQVELDERLRKIITNDVFQKVVGMDEGMFSRELYMSMDQIKCMVDNGMHFGSHGYDHYWLNSLSKDKQKFEIQKSLEFIKEIGGDTDNWTICYPYGAYDEDTISILKENGCKLGMTTRVGVADLEDKQGDVIFKLPRLDTNDLPKSANASVNLWYNK